MHYQHVEGFLYPQESAWLYAKLLQEIPWQHVQYYKPERGIVTTPRLTWCCGFHQEEHYEIHLPEKFYPNSIPQWLLPLKNFVEETLSQDFNFILFSYYRDGNDSIAFHSDNEKFLGPSPSIASITLGNPRPFLLKKVSTKQTQAFPLSAGDLFVMQNNCQQDYLHSIPKLPSALPRISLTFRKVLNEAGSKNYYKYNCLSTLL